jgi:hypothetical protein
MAHLLSNDSQSEEQFSDADRNLNFDSHYKKVYSQR